MTDEIDRIENERRRREAELLLLLLLLSAQARTAVRYAIRLDADPIAALRRVWLGGEHYPGAVTPIANAMLAAHFAGWNRTARLADVTLPLPDYAAGIYRPQAQFAAYLALQTMADRLRVALSGAMTPEARLQAATGAFRDNGWTMDRAWGLAQLTGLQIVSGYGNGMMDAAFATPKVLGFRHVSVLDDATTAICFSGSTRVNPIGSVNRVFKRHYEGEMLVIRTATGNQMTVTPNHPILTPVGWLPAKKLKPVENVRCAISDGGLCVHCSKNVGMPPTFAEFADAFFQPSVSSIQVKRSATADFHGDGGRRNEQVHVARANGNLILNFITSVFQQVPIKQFRRSCDRFASIFTALGSEYELFVSWLLSGMAAQLNAAFPQYVVEPAFVAIETPCYVGRVNPLVEPLQRNDSIGLGFRGPLTTLDEWHDANLAKLGRYSGNSDAVLPCNRCGRRAATIKFDNVVEMRSQSAKCHVYNLESSHGVYIADGIVVKNCNERDGLQLPKDDPYWLRNFVPLHFKCRSVIFPLMRSVVWSDWRPTVLPMAGFGMAPAWMGINRRAA